MGSESAAAMLKKPFCTPFFDYSIHTHAEARSLWRRACDLKARFFLNSVSLEAFDDGEKRACAMLIHAEMYLSDRLAYELSPPPSKMVIPNPSYRFAVPPEERKP